MLIEYVNRVILKLKSSTESDLKTTWKVALDKFIKHYVWHSPDLTNSNETIWRRLQSRQSEM